MKRIARLDANPALGVCVTCHRFPSGFHRRERRQRRGVITRTSVPRSELAVNRDGRRADFLDRIHRINRIRSDRRRGHIRKGTKTTKGSDANCANGRESQTSHLSLRTSLSGQAADTTAKTAAKLETTILVLGFWGFFGFWVLGFDDSPVHGEVSKSDWGQRSFHLACQFIFEKENLLAKKVPVTPSDMIGMRIQPLDALPEPRI